jgi:hypothetical protein
VWNVVEWVGCAVRQQTRRRKRINWPPVTSEHLALRADYSLWVVAIPIAGEAHV